MPHRRPAFLAESVYESVRAKIRRLQEDVAERDDRIEQLTQVRREDLMLGAFRATFTCPCYFRVPTYYPPASLAAGVPPVPRSRLESHLCNVATRACRPQTRAPDASVVAAAGVPC